MRHIKSVFNCIDLRGPNFNDSLQMEEDGTKGDQGLIDSLLVNCL